MACVRPDESTRPHDAPRPNDNADSVEGEAARIRKDDNGKKKTKHFVQWHTARSSKSATNFQYNKNNERKKKEGIFKLQVNTVFFFSCASLSCVICSKTGFHMLMCRKAVVGMPSSMFATINQIMQCRHRRRGYDETHCWVRQTQRRGVGFPYILNSIYPAFISVKFRKRKRGYEARRRMIVQRIYIYPALRSIVRIEFVVSLYQSTSMVKRLSHPHHCPTA